MITEFDGSVNSMTATNSNGVYIVGKLKSNIGIKSASEIVNAANRSAEYKRK